MLGSQGARLKRKPWEESIRVPGFIRWPGRVKAGSKSDVFFTHVDFAPTLLGMAGLMVPKAMQGKDLSKPIVEGKVRSSVVMTEPGRNGRGDKLVYTAADQKAVLTGANARLEDSEQGTTTGQELTYFVGGERVRVASRSGAGRLRLGIPPGPGPHLRLRCPASLALPRLV